MATIDSYVVHSRVNAVSPKAGTRLFLFAIAGCASIAIVLGLAFSGYAGTPWRAKFDARIAADSTPYPLNQDDEEVAAFQQSVAISHLTAMAPAPIEAARASPIIAKLPRVQKPASMVARKSMLAPVPPPRPASSEITLVDKVTPAVEKTAPVVGVASTPATPRTPVLIEIVHRIEHASDPVVDFASGVTGHLLGLRRKVGL